MLILIEELLVPFWQKNPAALFGWQNLADPSLWHAFDSYPWMEYLAVSLRGSLQGGHLAVTLWVWTQYLLSVNPSDFIQVKRCMLTLCQLLQNLLAYLKSKLQFCDLVSLHHVLMVM